MKLRCSGSAPAEGGGFTILELLVAMVITAVLLVLVVSIVSFSLKNFRQVDETVRLQSDASAALGMIATDLQALAVEVRPIEVLESQTESVSTTNGGAGLKFSWVMGLARLFDNPGSANTQSCGELRSFSYRVAYLDPITGTSTGTPIYALFRKTLPVGGTLTNVLAPMLTNASQGLYQNYWKDNGAPAGDDYLVGNIARFDVAWSYETANPTNASAAILATTPTNATIRYRQDQLTVNGVATNARLAKATITLTLLPESAVRALHGAAPTAEFIAQKGRNFSRQVTFGLP